VILVAGLSATRGAVLSVIAGFREGLPVREVVAEALLSRESLVSLYRAVPFPATAAAGAEGRPQAWAGRGLSRYGSLTWHRRCAGRCGRGTGPR
jgi:hypothetical protein